MFEWDEDKRLATLKKHNLDFYDAIEIFAQNHLKLPARSDIETRKIAVGILNGTAVSVIYTHRDETIRIITMRNARRDEREKLDAYLAGRREKDEKPH